MKARSCLNGWRGEHSYFFPLLCMFDPMGDLANPASDDPLAPTSNFGSEVAPRPAPRPAPMGATGASSRYGEELHSVTIRARQRTFYIDLKQSGSGKFLKISEKSRGGQKTTIIFDVEDLPAFIQALQEMQAKA